MKIIVHIQGNSEKTFASINEALSFARLQVYATQATIIRAFDALQDGKQMQVHLQQVFLNVFELFMLDKAIAICV